MRPTPTSLFVVLAIVVAGGVGAFARSASGSDDDASLVPADAERVGFDGWHSRHVLPFVPQVEALTRREVLEQILGNRDYWKANELTVETLH